MEPAECDSESAKDVTSDDCCCSGVNPTDSCFFGKDKTKWRKVKILHTFDADGKIF